MHRLNLGLYSHPKEFLGNGVRARVNSKGKIPSTGGKKNLLRGGQNARSCIKQDSEPKILPRSYSGPVYFVYFGFHALKCVQITVHRSLFVYLFLQL